MRSGDEWVIGGGFLPTRRCRHIASPYLDEEVRLEGWARHVGAFARFLEGISFSHESVLNIANVARECEVERKTVAAYVEVIEDLLLAFRVRVFTRRVWVIPVADFLRDLRPDRALMPSTGAHHA